VPTNSTDLAAVLSRRLRELGWSLAVAESLTSGRLACELGAAENASEWFRGGVIAYSEDVKFEVLNVDRGPVITARAAQQMAEGVRKLTGAEIGISTTGVGGPGPHEGQPAGTVFIGVCSPSGEEVSMHQFAGEPEEVIEQATIHALLLAKTSLPDQA
jgi:nicotinamide-nucleotide amidase